MNPEQITKPKKKSWYTKKWAAPVVVLIVLVLFGGGCAACISILNKIPEDAKDTLSKQTEQVGQIEEAEVREIEQGSFSSLEFTDVKVVDGRVLVSGTTDLPDGSDLVVGLDIWGRSGADLYIGVSEKTSVTQGQFEREITPPQREEFMEGPYEISVLFTPRNQADPVLELVGENGENLAGDLVDENIDFKTIKLIEKRDLQLSITLPSYTFQQLSEFQQGTPEHALAEYVSAWKDQDWGRMASLTQKTWQSNQNDPIGTLGDWYDFKDLKGFEISNINTVSNTMTDITFIVQYEAITNEISKKEITARVIKEIDPYTPSEQGQWGVNPISILKEEDID